MWLRPILSRFWLYVVLTTGMVNTAGASGYYHKALEHYRKAETSSAFVQLNRLLQENPGHRDGRHLLGKIHLENSRYQEAESELRRAIKLGTSIEQVAPSMAAALVGLQRYREARSFIKQNWKPGQGGQVRSRLLIGKTYQGMMPSWAPAEQALYPSLAIEASLKAHLDLARRAWAQGKPKEALTRLAAIGGNGDFGLEVLLLRGQILVALKDGTRALKTFRQVLERAPDNLLAQLGNAQAAMIAGVVDPAGDDIALLFDNAP